MNRSHETGHTIPLIPWLLVVTSASVGLLFISCAPAGVDCTVLAQYMREWESLPDTTHVVGMWHGLDENTSYFIQGDSVLQIRIGHGDTTRAVVISLYYRRSDSVIVRKDRVPFGEFRLAVSRDSVSVWKMR